LKYNKKRINPCNKNEDDNFQRIFNNDIIISQNTGNDHKYAKIIKIKYPFQEIENKSIISGKVITSPKKMKIYESANQTLRPRKIIPEYSLFHFQNDNCKPKGKWMENYNKTLITPNICYNDKI